jgi:hypothetical protein
MTMAYIPNAGTPSAIQLRIKALATTMYLDSPLNDGNASELRQNDYNIPSDAIPNERPGERTIQEDR